MALTEASFLTPTSSAQIAQQMFAPATNVLSSALNNAVESGRRMVDLQSHQEDIFMSEREKLRLANERKGLETRRIFESDRTFDESVGRDRRDFAESARRDDRDFILKNYLGRGDLDLKGRSLQLQSDLGWENADINRFQAQTQSDLGWENADINRRQMDNQEIHLRTQELRERQQSRKSDLYYDAASKKLNQTSLLGGYLDEVNPNLLGTPEPKQRSPFQLLKDALTPGDSETALYNKQQKFINDFKSKFTFEDIEEGWNDMTPEQQATVKLIGIDNLRRRQAGGSRTSPTKTNVSDLLKSWTTPAAKTASGKMITIALPGGQTVTVPADSNAPDGAAALGLPSNAGTPTGRAGSGSDLLLLPPVTGTWGPVEGGGQARQRY